MIGVLHVLERAHPAARSLHAQRIEYADLPKRWERFWCTTAWGTEFSTDRVEIDPQPAGERSVFFKTRHTAYRLEKVEL